MNFLRNIFKSSYLRKIEAEFKILEIEGFKKRFEQIAFESHLFYVKENIELRIFWEKMDGNPNIILNIKHQQIDLQKINDRILNEGNFESVNKQKQIYFIYKLTPLEVYLSTYVKMIHEFIDIAAISKGD